jgi:hypothetical protein
MTLREFTSREELIEHYREVNERLLAAAYAPPAPVPELEEPVPEPYNDNPRVDIDAIIKAIVDELNEENLLPKERIRRIIKRKEEEHGLPPGAITTNDHRRTYVVARQEAVVEAWTTVPVQSMPWLARIFKRDHTTVIHALRKAGLWRPKRPGEHGNGLGRNSEVLK